MSELEPYIPSRIPNISLYDEEGDPIFVQTSSNNENTNSSAILIPNEQQFVDSLLLLLLSSHLWTLIFTVIPVITTVGPTTYYPHHPNWYTGNDIIRFLEPFGGFFFNFWIFWKSGIFQQPFPQNRSHESNALIGFFLLGSVLYIQGAGFHSASNMFKNALETVPTATQQYNDLHYYLQTIWEHAISHYLYATGLTILYACQAYVYRELQLKQLSPNSEVLLFLSSFTFGMLVAGVSIEFPAGLIVGLIYIIGFGFGVLGGYIVYQKRTAKDQEKEKYAYFYGNRPVLSHFILGCIWAISVIFTWIGIFGIQTRKQASM